MIEGKKIRLVGEIPPYALNWRNDFQIRRYCRQMTLLDEASHKKWLERISNDKSIKMFGIEELEYGNSIGVCGLTSIDYINRTAEFSLYISKDYQGKGYGKDALMTLIKHGFDDWNLNRIWGETYETNPAYDLFRNIGFRCEGTLRESYFREGRYIDSYIVGMLRCEFEELKKTW